MKILKPGLSWGRMGEAAEGESSRSEQPLLLEAFAAGVREFLARLPEGWRAAVRERLVLELRDGAAAPEPWSSEEPGVLTRDEAENEAAYAVEILAQDPRVRRQTADWPDERLRALYSCFERYVLERLIALVGRDFGSEDAKRRAIALVVKQAVAEVARDPARWLAGHCKGE